MSKTDPHDSHVQELINQQWGDFKTVVDSSVGHLEEKYLRWRRLSMVAMALIIFGVIGVSEGDSLAKLLLSSLGLPSSLTEFTTVLAFLSLLLSIVILFHWSKVNREFSRALNPLVFEKAFAIVGVVGHHVPVIQYHYQKSRPYLTIHY